MQLNLKIDIALNKSKVLFIINTIIITLIFWQCIRKDDISIGDKIETDCEKITTDGNKFTSINNDQYLFDGAKNISDEVFRSGSHSVLTSENSKFALGIKLNNIGPAWSFKISVWRNKSDDNAFLVAASDDVNKLYEISSHAVEVDSAGWEKLVLSFNTPFDFYNDNIKIYVWNNSSNDIYFDDLKIERTKSIDYPVFKLSSFHIELDTNAYLKLLNKRSRAIENGLLQSSGNDWVKGMILYKDQILKSKLRLKGDWLDHLKGDKWSFRIKLKKSGAWNRLRTFSIQTPAARGFMYEWLAHKIFDKEDVLTTRYDFVPVFLNSSSRGLYAWEEHFVKQLLESRKRREGPILKFGEDGFWQVMKLRNKYKLKLSLPYYQASKIEVFEEGKTLSSDVLYKELINGQKLMAQYKNQLFVASEIFDIDKFARYFALIDVLRAYHSRAWHNQRFYYNPVICKLEPIAYDCYGEKPEIYHGIENNYVFRILKNKELHENEYDLISKIFTDKTLSEKYINYLSKFSSKEYIDNIFEQFDKQLFKYDSLIQLEFPNTSYDKNFLYTSADDIRSYLPELESFLKTYNGDDSIIHNMVDEKILKPEKNIENTSEFFVNAYSENKVNDSSLILIENYYPENIQILGTSLNGKFIEKYFINPISIDAFNGEVNTQKVKLDTSDLFIHYKLSSSDEVNKCIINRWPKPEGLTPRQYLLSNYTIDSSLFERITIDDYVLKTGKIILSKPLIIPTGKKLIINRGTEVDLKDSAFILSFGPVEFIGTNKKRIKIFSSDFSSRGVTVLQSKEISKIHYVDFENLNTFSYKNWFLTGAVTFYESDVEIYNSLIYRNQCEDALNIVRSNFTVKDCSFKNIFSDAFDSDFSTGNLISCTFETIGNDAIDFSGSKINIAKCNMADINDKGISGGEQSNLTISDCNINRANIGIASKDLSALIVNNSKITDCYYGLVLLKKKPEYGSASIEINNSEIVNAKKNMLIEVGSTVKKDGKMIIGKEKNVAKLFY